jgi:hypothetical protein
MDDQTIDSFVDQIAPLDNAVEATADTTEQVAESVSPDVEAVAPVEQAGTELSSDDAPPAVETPVETAHDPYAERLAAMEAQLTEVSQKAQNYDALQQAVMQRQREQAMQAQRNEWQERALAIENISDDATRKREAARLVQEVEVSRQFEASQMVQQRDSMIHQREQEAESSAAIGAAMYHAIQNDPDLTPAKKKELLENSKFLSKLPSPAAQQATLQREQQITTAAIERAKKQWEAQHGITTQAKAQDRIAKDTDLAKSPVSPGTGRSNATIDDFVDSVFR